MCVEGLKPLTQPLKHQTLNRRLANGLYTRVREWSVHMHLFTLTVNALNSYYRKRLNSLHLPNPSTLQPQP